ncbi:phage portal protein [Sporolactobacillus sp. STCC-11]|uniref:phage portal protein n=1 Tax=Sporolactobacillus caesalpiniae TaxID=3230362 RepID=UPI00339A422B
MGLFEKIFGKRTPQSSGTHRRFEMINDAGNGFYQWNGSLYKSDIVRSCIRPKAKAVGKLVAKHVRNNATDFKVNPDPGIRFLLEEPNPLMTGQVMQEKLITQLELNNNAFAYIKRDELGVPIEIYPIPCTTVDVVEGALNDIFLKFVFGNGKQMTVPYVDVIHLRKDFNEDDFFGDSPGEALAPLMKVVTTTDQGIVKAIMNSAMIRWILHFSSVLKPEDIQKQVDDFTNNYLNIAKNRVAAPADPRYTLEQVKPESYVPNADQMKETTLRIHSFFNTNQKIIQSDYTEDEWNAYFESEIEPVAMQLSGEYTRRLFSRRERGFGNSIIFEASNLQHASMKTKLNLLQMVDRGALTPNEWRSVFNLAPIEGGDKPIRRLDTAPVTKGGDGNGEGGDPIDGDGQNGDSGS